MYYKLKTLRSFKAPSKKTATQPDEQMIFNNVSDAIIFTDLKFSILTCNKAAETCFSCNAKGLKGKNMMKLLNYKFPDTNLAAVRKKMLETGKWCGEVLAKTGDGTQVYFDSKLFFTYNALGKKNGIVSVNADTTEKRLLESRMRFLNNYTHIVLNSTREAIFLLDTSGNIRNYNEYARQLIKNFTGSDIKVINNLFDAVPKERKTAVVKFISEASKGKLKEYEVKYPDGKWLEVCFCPENNHQGTVQEICCTLKDITERKRTEERIHKKRIEQLKLVANATIKGQEDKQNEIGRELHDNVNQLLAASKMTLSIVLKTKKASKELISKSMEYIQMANDEIRQLTHTLVAPVFKNASLKSGLEKLINECKTGANVNIDTTKLVETGMDANLKLALYRIAQEQLNNIGKYADASEIYFLAERNRDNVRLYIEDNGVGFEMASIKRGIGINNIYSRAESFYGTAKITSSPGNGCKLEVIIPLARPGLKN